MFECFDGIGPFGSLLIPDHPEIRKSASGTYTKELEEVIISTQLDRVPSIFRKVFELKARGDDYVPERPKDGPLPKYWNNEPKNDASKGFGFHEMAQMKQECKKHKEKIKKEQVNLMNSNAIKIPGCTSMSSAY